MEAGFARTNRPLWEREREQELRNAPMRVRCSPCSWVFEGRAADGVKAARDHRRESHPELPYWSPEKQRRRFSPRTDDKTNRDAAKVLDVLRNADRPLRAGEIAEQTGLSKYAVGPLCRWIEDAVQPRPGRWALVGKELSEAPRPDSEAETRRAAAAARREAVLKAVAELRDRGNESAPSKAVAELAGCTGHAAGKVLGIEGFENLGKGRWNLAPPTLI
jgi:hypothetical protein